MAVNLQEAVPDGEIIDDLLQLDGENNKKHAVPQERWLEQERQQAEQEQGKEKRKPVPKKGQGGRPAIHQKYPHLVADVESFIQLNGFAAREPWSTEKATSCGVTLQQIRAHVQQKTPFLQISCSTIHHLMLPPSKARSSKHLYKSPISVCIPSKRNDSTSSDNEDHHYTISQVAYWNELFQLYEEEYICISADGTNKINVGSLAVCRYFQLLHIFPTTHSPDFLDHDFPVDAKYHQVDT